VNLGWHRDRKENPISGPSIHVGALVGAGFTLAQILLQKPISLIFTTPLVFNGTLFLSALLDAHCCWHIVPLALLDA